MKRMRLWAGVLAMAALGPARAAPPAAVTGVVTRVLAADTVQLTPPGQPAIVVRLRDIEPPEPCQPWGPEAKAGLVALALNKPATLRPSGRDAQGRTLGVVFVDNANLAQRMVEEGHAWSVRGRNDHGPFIKQERMAKSLGRGLHATAGAVMPREWRRTRGACPA